MLGQTASIGEVVLGLGLLGGAMPALDNLMPASQSINQDDPIFFYINTSLCISIFPKEDTTSPCLACLMFDTSVTFGCDKKIFNEIFKMRKNVSKGQNGHCNRTTSLIQTFRGFLNAGRTSNNLPHTHVSTGTVSTGAVRYESCSVIKRHIYLLRQQTKFGW